MSAILKQNSDNKAFFDPTGTRWRVASFENGNIGGYNETPWVFLKDNIVKDEHDRWKDNWTQNEQFIDRIDCKKNSTDPGFQIVFVNKEWFVAIAPDNADGELFRIGKIIVEQK